MSKKPPVQLTKSQVGYKFMRFRDLLHSKGTELQADLKVNKKTKKTTYNFKKMTEIVFKANNGVKWGLRNGLAFSSFNLVNSRLQCMVDFINDNCETDADMKGLVCPSVNDMIGSFDCGINGLADGFHHIATQILITKGKLNKCNLSEGVEKELIDTWVVNLCEGVPYWTTKKAKKDGWINPGKSVTPPTIYKDYVDVTLGAHSTRFFPFYASLEKDNARDILIRHNDYDGHRMRIIRRTLLSRGWKKSEDHISGNTELWAKKTMDDPRELKATAMFFGGTKDIDLAKIDGETSILIMQSVYDEAMKLVKKDEPLTKEDEDSMLFVVQAHKQGIKMGDGVYQSSRMLAPIYKKHEVKK